MTPPLSATVAGPNGTKFFEDLSERENVPETPNRSIPMGPPRASNTRKSPDDAAFQGYASLRQTTSNGTNQSIWPHRQDSHLDRSSRPYVPEGSNLLPIMNPHRLSRAPTYPPPQKTQRKRRFRWSTLLLILIILALFGDIIFLNVRVVELTEVINRNTPSPVPTLTLPNSSSEAVEECLSQFTIDAPSNPSAYPCSTCLPILSNMTNNSNATHAVQFCGLRAFLESTSTTGQTALSNGGWGKDLDVCTWSGVSCSDSGLVRSL